MVWKASILENKYSLKITRNAYNDLSSIFSYISEELKNDTAALEHIDEIGKAIQRLKAYPESGSYVSHNNLPQKRYRKLLIKNYIVFYVVEDTSQTVIIMRVLYGKRDYGNLL